eukprot:g8128.t1
MTALASVRFPTPRMKSVRRAAAEAAADTQNRQSTSFNRQLSGSGSFQSFNPETFNNIGPTSSAQIPAPNLRSQITEAPKRIDREKANNHFLTTNY